MNLACALVVCPFRFVMLPDDIGTKKRLNAFASSEPRMEQRLKQLCVIKPNSPEHL